jgi:hypothetical protein
MAAMFQNFSSLKQHSFTTAERISVLVVNLALTPLAIIETASDGHTPLGMTVEFRRDLLKNYAITCITLV